jgi:hypothetical protein
MFNISIAFYLLGDQPFFIMSPGWPVGPFPVSPLKEELDPTILTGSTGQRANGHNRFLTA